MAQTTRSKVSITTIQADGTVSATSTTVTTTDESGKVTKTSDTVSSAATTPFPKRLRYDYLMDLQQQYNEIGSEESVASDKEWEDAWKEKQLDLQKKEIGRESHSDPTPLLIDKISSLPANSNQRRSAENLSLTLKGEGSNVGYGLDAVTRESYKDTKRIVKHSAMLQEGIKEPLPAAEDLVGQENGQVVSNVQNWKAPLANAVKPVSDAMGSHSDTASSVVKSPTGPDQQLPAAVNATVDRMSPQMVNEVNLTAKSVQLDSLQHMPSKMSGSVRHLATASDKALSVPFEIASDVYHGLLGVVNEISNFTDAVMANITNHAISAAGGLIDGIFPASNLTKLLGPIGMLASEIGNLTQLLGGFSAVSNIAMAIGGINQNLSSALRDPSKLRNLLATGAAIADIVGGLAGKNSCDANLLGMNGANSLIKVLDKATAIVGVIGGLSHLAGDLGKVGSSLGNLGSIIGKGIPKNLGDLTKNLRNPGQLITGLLPSNLAQAHDLLHKLCNLGMVGNAGYSVGTSMDGLRNSAFTKAMETHAAHASIIAPLFNKEAKHVGSYAQEDILNFFQESVYVKGAQGNKGITMHGPGGTAPQKAFSNGIGDPNDTTASQDFESAATSWANNATWMDEKAKDPNLSPQERAEWATLAAKSRENSTGLSEMSTVARSTNYDSSNAREMQANRDRINAQRAARGEAALPPPKNL